MEQDAFFWPRMIAAIRSESPLPFSLQSSLVASGVDCHAVDEQNLVVDISYLQDTRATTQAVVARLQHLLNLELSPFSYALGLSSEAVLAVHAATCIRPGREKWILPWQFEEAISTMPVAALTTVDIRMPEFFRACNKHRCGELREFGKEFLRHRFGNAGETLWYLLRGKLHQLPVQRHVSSNVISWQLSLPVRTRSHRALSAHAWRLYTMVNRNLGNLNRQAGYIELECRALPASDRKIKVIRIKPMLHRRSELSPFLKDLELDRQMISHLRITASDLTHPAGQLDLF